MTRINVGVSPSELPGKLLLAEHREITRIPNAVKSGRAVFKDIPKLFTLGKGHVKFFYDKCGYLAVRYSLLYTECRKRGYKVTSKHSAFQGLPAECYQFYFPSASDRRTVIERITQKGFVLQKPKR